MTLQANINLAMLAQVLKKCDDFVICGHVNPDGDCIGSQLALAATLRALDKHVTCLFAEDEPVDSSLCFLPGFEDIIPATSFRGTVHTFVAVDVPTYERMGSVAAALCESSDVFITIDHHVSDKPMSNLSYVDSKAASTTTLIWELASLLGVERGGDIALCCYTGLVTDTGRFQYQNTNAAALRAAYQMVDAGVDPAFVARVLFQNRSLPSMRLESIAIARLHLGPMGAYALSWISLEDFEAVGAVKSDAEPVIDVLRSLVSVRVACMLREQNECVRGSLRAKDDTDVSLLARIFGGGGHKAAAGFTLNLTLAEAIPFVEEKIAELCADMLVPTMFEEVSR